MAPRFPDMPNPGNTSGGSTRRPLQENNGRNSNVDAVLRSIPEGKKTDLRNNISRAVCVKDGIGHDVAEDQCMDTENGLSVFCLLSMLSFNNINSLIIYKLSELQYEYATTDQNFHVILSVALSILGLKPKAFFADFYCILNSLFHRRAKRFLPWSVVLTVKQVLGIKAS